MMPLRLAHRIDAMVKATRVSAWSRRYHLDVDGRQVSTWDGSWWKSGGTLTHDGRSYGVRGNVWGTELTMTDSAGAVVATAAKLSRRNWTVTSGGRTYSFRRPSYWRYEEQLMDGDRAVGAVRRTSMWRSDVEADLPTLPAPVQVFVVAVALTRWDSEDSAG
jgi:hypothetical protein